jgi:hypothetical protein
MTNGLVPSSKVIGLTSEVSGYPIPPVPDSRSSRSVVPGLSFFSVPWSLASDPNATYPGFKAICPGYEVMCRRPKVFVHVLQVFIPKAKVIGQGSSVTSHGRRPVHNFHFTGILPLLNVTGGWFLARGHWSRSQGHCSDVHGDWSKHDYV